MQLRTKAHVRDLAAALLLGMFPLAACAQALTIQGEQIADAATYGAAKKEGPLVVYGTAPSDIMEPILEAFAADSGIRTQTVRATTQRMYARVMAEFTAKKLQADYIDLTDLPLIKELTDKGVLGVAHKVPSFDVLPAKIRDPQGRWYAVLRPVSSVIAVNTAVAGEKGLPAKWNDLLDPKWTGKIGMPGIDVGGSTFVLFAFLRDKVDPDYWTKLGKLKPRIYPGSTPSATDLARGETAIAIGGATQLIAQKVAGAPVKIIFPAEGVSSFPIAGGIARNAKNPAAAKVFLNWMTSRRGGQFISRSANYAAHPDAPRPQQGGITMPEANAVWDIDVAHWENVRAQYLREWRTAMGVK